MCGVLETPVWDLRHRPAATRPATSSSGIRCEMIELLSGAKRVTQDTGQSLEIRTFGYWYTATPNTSSPVRTLSQAEPPNQQNWGRILSQYHSPALQLPPAQPAHCLWWAIGAKFSGTRLLSLPMALCDYVASGFVHQNSCCFWIFIPPVWKIKGLTTPSIRFYPRSTIFPFFHSHNPHRCIPIIISTHLPLKPSICNFQRLRETGTFAVASSLLQSCFPPWGWARWPLSDPWTHCFA